jgi:hypothetical protein
VATGNIASDIQDVRLHTPRAWFNVAGLISSGNSGGALVDDRGRLIGVPTQIGGSGADVAKRARPIDLAKPLIEAAKKGTKYASPYITPLPPKASIGAAAYDGEGGPGGFTSECASSHRNLSTRPPSLRVDVSYSGYEADRHQDMLVWILDQGGAPLPTSDPLLFDTNTQFPFKFNASGCVSIELPVTGIDLTRQTFTVVVAAGPEYRLRSELKLSGGTTDTTTTSTAPSPVDTSAPPVDTGAPPPAG